LYNQSINQSNIKNLNRFFSSRRKKKKKRRTGAIVNHILYTAQLSTHTYKHTTQFLSMLLLFFFLIRLGKSEERDKESGGDKRSIEHLLGFLSFFLSLMIISFLKRTFFGELPSKLYVD
jgi:hypothetical protein